MDNPFVNKQAMQDIEAEYGDAFSSTPEEDYTTAFDVQQEESYGKDFADQQGAHAAVAAGTLGLDPEQTSATASAGIMSGNSELYKELTKQTGAPSSRELAGQALKILSIPDLPKETYDAARAQYEANKTVRGGSVPENNNSNLAAVEPAVLPGQEDVLAARSQYFAKEAEAMATLDSMMDKYFASVDSSTIKAVSEMADLVALPETTALTKQVIEHMANNGWMSTSWTDYIAPGSNIKDIVAVGKDLPPEQKVKFFSDFMTGLAQANSIVGDKNNYVAYTIAQAVKEHIQEGTPVGTGAVFLDNLEVAGLLPVVATVAKGVVRVGKTMYTVGGKIAAQSMHPMSAVSGIASAAPNTAEKQMALLVKNPNYAAAAGTTADELLLSYGLPKYTEFDLQNAPANIVDAINHAETYGAQAFDKALYKGFLIDAAGEQASVDAALLEARALAGRVPELHAHNQVVTRMEEGFTYSTMYGNGNVGFARKGDALDKAQLSGLFDVESPTFEIVSINPKTKELLVEYNGAKDYGKSFKDVSGGKEYFIRTTNVRRYDDVFATALDPAQAPKIGLLTKLASAFTKSFTTFRSVEATLPRNIAAAVTANFTSKVALENSLKAITKHYDKLSDGEKARVMYAVNDGANYADASGNVIGKEFSYTELVGRGLSEKEIAGYFQLRQLVRTTHAIRNRALLEQLEREGYKRIINEGVDFDTIGNIVDPATLDDLSKEISEVYDPVSKAAIPVDAQALKDAYMQGKGLVRMKSSMRHGANKYDYALVPDIDTSLRELPVQVLSDAAGYAGPRIYKENVFIEAYDTNMRINGKAIPKEDPRSRTIIAAASSVDEAMKIINDIGPTPGTIYKPRYGRELVNNMDGWELDNASGSLYYSKRGQPLVGYEQRAARVLDPVRALEVNKNNIAKITHTDALVAQLEASWVKTYGNYARKGVFPNSRDDIITDLVGKSDATNISKAQAMWDLIDMYKFSGEENAAYRQIMLHFAKALDTSSAGKIRGLLADTFYAAGREGISPLSRLKSVTFGLGIAARPIRQIYLQAAQHLYLGSVDHKAFGLAYKQMSGMAVYESMQKLGKGNALELGAKAAGMSVKEFRNLTDGFKASGLLSQIDSHAAVSGTLKNPAASLWDGHNLKYFKDKAIDTVVRKPLHFLRSVGFDKGEAYNQLMTYLFSYNRLEARLGKKVNLLDRKEMDMLIGETNLTTFNMTAAGELGMQRGWARNLTQFMSFQVKSLQNMFGVTNTFTAAERTKMAVVTLGLWGAGGFGLREFYEKLKIKNNAEIDPTTDEIISGGLAEMALNKSINILAEDDEELKSRVAFSENTSPFSGVMFWDMIGWDKPFYETMLGASGHTGKKLYDAVKYAGDFWFHSDLDSDPERLAVMTTNLASVVPLISDTGKSYLALKYGMMYDKNSDPKVRTTAAEGLSILAGMYPVRAKQKDIMTSLLSDRTGDLDKDAQTFVRIMFDVMDSPDHVSLNGGKEFMATLSGTLSTYPEEDRMYIRGKVDELLRTKYKKRNADVTRLWNRLAYKAGEPGLQEAISKLDEGQFKYHVQELKDSLEP